MFSLIDKILYELSFILANLKKLINQMVFPLCNPFVYTLYYEATFLYTCFHVFNFCTLFLSKS